MTSSQKIIISELIGNEIDRIEKLLEEGVTLLQKQEMIDRIYSLQDIKL